MQSMEASDPYFYAASSSRYQASRTLLEDVLRDSSWKSSPSAEEGAWRREASEHAARDDPPDPRAPLPVEPAAER